MIIKKWRFLACTSLQYLNVISSTSIRGCSTMSNECVGKPCIVCSKTIQNANYYCPRCKACICFYCGADLLKEVEAEYLKCPNCGTKLKWSRFPVLCTRFSDGICSYLWRASMSNWMVYGCEWFLLLSDTADGPVSIDVLGSNGNFREIGATASDESSFFKIAR